MTEVQAVRQVFSERKFPLISSTKSLTGHSLGAAGVQEAIYSILMISNNFVAGSANIFNLDPDLKNEEIALEAIVEIELDVVLSNSFGFGGTNASLALARYLD